MLSYFSISRLWIDFSKWKRIYSLESRLESHPVNVRIVEDHRGTQLSLLIYTVNMVLGTVLLEAGHRLLLLMFLNLHTTLWQAKFTFTPDSYIPGAGCEVLSLLLRT